MNCLLEAIGLALPGNGTILAVDPERQELARAAGTADHGAGRSGHQAARHRHAAIHR